MFTQRDWWRKEGMKDEVSLNRFAPPASLREKLIFQAGAKNRVEF